MDINIARDLIAQTDEGSYYLGLGMSLWYTGTEEYIEGRNCPVFVIGTDHEEHFTKEKYYAAGDNVVYYYDPSVSQLPAKATHRLTDRNNKPHYLLPHNIFLL